VSPLSSRRKRIRLAWLLGVAALAGGLAAAGLTLANTAPPQQQARRGVARQPYRPPPTVPLRGERRREAIAVAQAFVRKAVFRRDSAGSWDLVSPALRRGYTRSDWATGTIPVVPFQGKALLQARWKVSYSYASRLAFDVLFLTKPGSGVRPAVFTIGLVSDRRPGKSGWLVSSWSPTGTAAPTPPPAVGGGIVTPPHQLAPVWLLLPAALAALIVGLPVGLWLVGWRRGRRAARAYAAALPPLPGATSERSPAPSGRAP
jgi:hypothetical protein